MRIVIAHIGLVHFGGTETYIEAVATQLQRMGHDVTLWAPAQGPMAEALRERGLVVAATERELGDAPDRVLSNSADVAYELASRWPDVPQAYVCHSEVYDLQTPPQLPGVAGALVVLNDRVARWAGALAHRPEVVRLRQPVDLARFAPRGTPPRRARRVLLLGNYARGARRALVEDACARAGLEAVTVGHVATPTDRPELAIAEADVVMGKARVIVEAMAGGRAAYVYDHNGGDGWVTPERYARLESDNFGGQATDETIDAQRLIRDLAAYDPEMGLVNRDLAVRHHSVIHHCEQLVALLERLGRPGPAAPATAAAALPLREMARVIRLGWATHGALTGARAEAERAHDRVAELERELDALRDHAAALEERVAEVEAFRRTRRYRLALALAAPADRLRGR